MSFGLSTNGRRSTPTTGRSRCRTRATRLPRRPQIPVTSTAGPSFASTIDGVRPRGADEGGGCVWISLTLTCSPENVLSLFQRTIEHRLDRLLHQPYLLLHHGVVLVRIAREVHRLTEPDPVLRRERELTS